MEAQNTECGKNQKELLFVGAPLLDITAHGSQETLDEYGLKSDDCIRATDKHESLFQSLFNNPDSHISAGGSSQNTARIAKWILGARLKVYFTGCVGEDDYATKMLNCLKSEGVEPLYITLPGESTGICSCLLNLEGDRSMCARLGAAEKIRKHHLEGETVRERVQRADCVFVEGYFFSHSPDVMLALSEMCADNQVFSISLSAEYICRDHTETLLKVLPRVDVLFSNEAEAKTLAKSLGLGDIPVDKIGSILAAKDRPVEYKPRIVVITRGPSPVLLVNGTESASFIPVPEGVKVIDSVACGDALAGAFLAVYIHTGDVTQAVKTGIAASVEIAQVRGCNPPKKSIYPLGDR